MNLETAKAKLYKAREEARVLRKKIDELRKIIFDLGEDPDAPQVDLIPRNKQMYKKWKEGASFNQIALEFQKSSTLVGNVCKRIDKILDRKGFKYDLYKDMIKYRKIKNIKGIE